MSDRFFVPLDFAVPDGLTAEEFRLEPLGPQHNAADYAAWTASIGHIQATPGFAGTDWPHEMSLAENLRDLERHAQDFAERRGFTYTVLSTSTGEVIGCVCIYPPRSESPARVNRMRPSVPGCARTVRRSTQCSTTRSALGWNATGRSTRSSTRHGSDLVRPVWVTCQSRAEGTPD
ncbi:MAG TPA: hypothetical protein VLW50_20060 [Streptosporangiaceae bacterium]|nr:hypothetical protein [Streptosporangiaceae bacterium]